jgi:hypothetical protein
MNASFELLFRNPSRLRLSTLNSRPAISVLPRPTLVVIDWGGFLLVRSAAKDDKAANPVACARQQNDTWLN